jgi:hypothetical protein
MYFVISRGSLNTTSASFGGCPYSYPARTTTADNLVKMNAIMSDVAPVSSLSWSFQDVIHLDAAIGLLRLV